MCVGLDEAVEPYFGCEPVEGCSLHYLAACAGEESFPLAFVAVEYDVAYYGLEDGIAEEFQPFVVERSPFLGAVGLRLVCQSYTVYFEVVGVESEDAVQGREEVFVLSEGVFYPVDEINDHSGQVYRLRAKSESRGKWRVWHTSTGWYHWDAGMRRFFGDRGCVAWPSDYF